MSVYIFGRLELENDPQLTEAWIEADLGLTVKALKWSEVPPTAQGWYWIVPKGERVVVLRYVDELNGVTIVLIDADYNHCVAMAEYAERVSHWLGPLPEPEMPE